MKKLAINPSNKKYYSDDYIKGWEDGVKAQYEATKDAVEVVRCGECKKQFTNNCYMIYGKNMMRNLFDNDFCSYGERRMKDGVDSKRAKV